MVGKLLAQERLTELLNSGKVSLDASDLGGMGRLSQVASSILLETAKRIRLVSPVEFSLQLGSGQDAGDISLHFEGDGWKPGIRLPSAVLDTLAGTGVMIGNSHQPLGAEQLCSPVHPRK